MQLELFFFFLVKESQMPKKFGFRKNRRGQGLVEYIVIVASVALIALTSVSMFGHKLSDQYAVGAGMLPGAHAEDNNPIRTGYFAQVNESGGEITGTGAVGWADITGNSEVGEMDNNVIAQGTNDGEAFVAELE
jgi:Flp pilus assembly pilin Flp